MKNNCIDCGKGISKSHNRCRSCAQRLRWKNSFSSKSYYCKDCKSKICMVTALYGKGRCRSCSHKGNKNAFYGKNHSLETKIHFSKIRTGIKPKPFTEEHKRKISESHTREKNWNWKGGRSKDDKGYILIYSPNHTFAVHGKYVREHRLIMEKYLGRYLTRKEVVHHINGIKTDNRIENLVLCTDNKEHLRNYHKCESRKF